jgi:hypothetical protein
MVREKAEERNGRTLVGVGVVAKKKSENIVAKE